MSDLSKYLGRGLLVLALSGSVFACGDDDDNPPGDDDAGMAGRGGSGGAGRGGTGGAGRGGGGGTGGTDGGAPTVDECIDAVDDATSGSVSEDCAECLCEDSPEEVSECNATCWGLISCFATNCGDETPGTTGGDMCAVANCMSFLGQAAAAGPVGMVIRGECPELCTTADPVDDAGTDAGN